ncbi:hypothetical protein [Thermococcus sp.]|nr:hypothetical protein [Thermococcus sp.]
MPIDMKTPSALMEIRSKRGKEIRRGMLTILERRLPKRMTSAELLRREGT